jgi:hypothetical protein
VIDPEQDCIRPNRFETPRSPVASISAFRAREQEQATPIIRITCSFPRAEGWSPSPIFGSPATRSSKQRRLGLGLELGLELGLD